MLRVSHNTCHLASSFNATASVTGRYTCPQNLLDHRNESFKIHYTTGRLLPIKDQCLDSYDNKDLKITKSKTSEQYFRDKFVILSVSSMNTLLAILEVTDARRDVILAGGLNHRFPWRHLPPNHPRRAYHTMPRFLCYYSGPFWSTFSNIPLNVCTSCSETVFFPFNWGVI